jgi:DNA-binding response OmpR family regulator
MPKILIVEDDPAVRDVVEYALSREGMETEAVSSAEAATERLFSDAAFDLVILDLMLPDTDGVTLCRELRSADCASRDVPIVMLTARDDETSVVVGLEVGADDYVTKPFSPRQLV